MTVMIVKLGNCFIVFLYSSTNGFQENHSFSFANVLPHGVCSVVYHPQYSLLIVGSLTGQGQRNSTGKLTERDKASTIKATLMSSPQIKTCSQSYENHQAHLTGS